LAEKHGRLDSDSADDKKSGGGSTGGLSHLEKQGLEAIGLNVSEIKRDSLVPEVAHIFN